MTPVSDEALDTLHSTATQIFTGAIQACNIQSAFDRRIRFEGNTLERLLPDGSGPAKIELSATSASSSSHWARRQDPCWIPFWSA